ncbi:MAG: plastocyanin/azurin family copper-binding protein, partial [Dehalococcoidia bacterium]|nr:plastocyanin/azurin family copper-binding protein [Dehalococcoidia bacterium]
ELVSSGLQATVRNAPNSSQRGCEETNSCFLPSTVMINVGGTVTWENGDIGPHSATSRIFSPGGVGEVIGSQWDSGVLTKGNSFSHTFDGAGTYNYLCTIHPWMQGTVIVEAEVVPVVEVYVPPPVIEEVDLLSVTTLDSDFMDGTESQIIQKESLNKRIAKMTISAWINPVFDTGLGKYAVISKSGSYDLFVTDYKVPWRTVGLTVFDGIHRNSISSYSTLSEDWHHIVGVVNDSDFSLYLDGHLEKKGTMKPTFSSNEQGEIVEHISYMAASDNSINLGSDAYLVMICDERSSDPLACHYEQRTRNNFQGLITKVKIITDSLTDEQVFDLYSEDKDRYQKKDITPILEQSEDVDSAETVTVMEQSRYGSPALSDSECMDLAKQRGFNQNSGKSYTLVCQFPFDVIIPLNSRIFWVETLSLEDAPYHGMRSFDNLFHGSGATADMGFYEPDFSHGVYEYYDVYNKSLTGKIIISEPINAVSVSADSNKASCADNYSCYDPYTVKINAGEQLVWRNYDLNSHTVTGGTPDVPTPEIFDSGSFKTYEYFRHTFDEVGTYNYFCTLHPWMQGIVVVK